MFYARIQRRSGPPDNVGAKIADGLNQFRLVIAKPLLQGQHQRNVAREGAPTKSSGGAFVPWDRLHA